MKLNIHTQANVQKGSIELPAQFVEPVRPDLVKRAVEAIQSHKRQAYGADPEAGMRHSANVSKRRRKYRGCYGKGISRVPRKVMTRRGTQMNWTGAIAPGTVGGRRAHAPKAEKIWDKKINIKERRKAIRSALAATVIKEAVEERGHKVPKDFPFVLDNSFESLSKTKDVIQSLEKLGLKDEIERTSEKKIRAGKGKLRGRKYITKKGPLLVVSKDCPLLKSGINIPGVEVVKVNEVNAELLAPGAAVGRLTLYTEDSIKKLDAEKLFTDEVVVEKVDRKVVKKQALEEKKKKAEEKKKKKAAKKKPVKKEAAKK
jgi:large subunit ribosomal protein L4e